MEYDNLFTYPELKFTSEIPNFFIQIPTSCFPGLNRGKIVITLNMKNKKVKDFLTSRSQQDYDFYNLKYTHKCFLLYQLQI